MGERISVIMPCYNAASFLERGVGTVLSQTWEDVELIIIDDGSTDGTGLMLDKMRDSRIKIVKQANRGVAAARNAGLLEATGKFVAFLDVDDTWRVDALEKLVQPLLRTEDVAIAYCGWQNVGLCDGRGEPYVPPEYEDENKLACLIRACPWPIHAALARRETVVAVGGFPVGVKHAEDYALWLRIACFAPIVRVPEVLAYYHFHGVGQASENKAAAALAHWNIQQEFLRHHGEIVASLGKSKIRELTDGYLLERGFDCYWRRDLVAARKIFRAVLGKGRFQLKNLKYLLPALLPLYIHRYLIGIFEQRK